VLLCGVLPLRSPAVVDIPFVTGVPTVVSVHFVVGVPTVWLASLLFKFHAVVGVSDVVGTLLLLKSLHKK
jgi:hypothetical protein